MRVLLDTDVVLDLVLAIVTRDVSDYKNATLPILSPREFLNKLKSQQI